VWVIIVDVWENKRNGLNPVGVGIEVVPKIDSSQPLLFCRGFRAFEVCQL
jgi:hypothetical protein